MKWIEELLCSPYDSVREQDCFTRWLRVECSACLCVPSPSRTLTDACEWVSDELFAFHVELQQSPETFLQVLRLFYASLELHQPGKGWSHAPTDLWRLALTCMYVNSKAWGDYIDAPWGDQADPLCLTSERDVLTRESLVLTAVDWNCLQPTAIDFYAVLCRRYMARAGINVLTVQHVLRGMHLVVALAMVASTHSSLSSVVACAVSFYLHADAHVEANALIRTSMSDLSWKLFVDDVNRLQPLLRSTRLRENRFMVRTFDLGLVSMTAQCLRQFASLSALTSGAAPSKASLCADAASARCQTPPAILVDEPVSVPVGSPLKRSFSESTCFTPPDDEPVRTKSKLEESEQLYCSETLECF